MSTEQHVAQSVEIDVPCDNYQSVSHSVLIKYFIKMILLLKLFSFIASMLFFINTIGVIF